MKPVALVAALILLSPSAVVAADPTPWPELPTEGFIAGRVATTDDVRAGVAAFTQSGHPGARPMRIAVPQYGCHGGEEPQGRVVVVQAEDSIMGGLIGVRLANGDLMIVLGDEVTLLGTTRPTDKDCL